MENKMKGIFTLLAAIIMLHTLLSAQTPVAPSGSGTQVSPYQISTWQNLYWISQNSSSWSSYFIQTADIDFADADPAINTWASGAGWTPIGNTSTAFTGSYNGQNLSIIGLYINNASGVNMGLFGYIMGSGAISNLFVQATITGYSEVGALVGNIDDSNVSITNCHSNATVTSTNTTFNGPADAGGLVGIIAGGSPTIANCSSSGTVTGQGLRNVGGLIGYLDGGTVRKSFSTANVINTVGTQGNTGGFIGGINSNGNNTLIEDCFAAGNVSGGSNDYITEWTRGIGAFIGTSRREYSGYSKTITNCFALGVVTQIGASSDIGGLIGRFSTTTSTSNPTVNNCFWDTERTGQITTAGNRGTGLTTANMKIQGSFTDWDFTSTWKMSSSITYDGYPTLEWAKGYSTAPTSNQIAGLDNLVYVAENSSRWATSYTQTADINAWWTCGWDYQEGWTPIGSSSTQYSGTYNGNGFTISDIFINRNNVSSQALFGELSTSGVITELGIISSNVNVDNSSWFENYGLLVGANSGTIEHCFSSGSVTLSNSGADVGGLVGENNGYISNSYSRADVSRTNSESRIGGLVGYNSGSGTITKCFSTGSVPSGGGGFCGANGTTITHCFYDANTSGRSDTGKGEPKTTAEMTTEAQNNINNFYILAGWDFKGVGSEGIWNIQSDFNNGYPYLDWQNPSAIPLPVELSSFTANVNENNVILNWQTATEWASPKL